MWVEGGGGGGCEILKNRRYLMNENQNEKSACQFFSAFKEDRFHRSVVYELPPRIPNELRCENFSTLSNFAKSGEN